MKKSIPKVRERESEASILGNDWEREFPLTPVLNEVPVSWFQLPECVANMDLCHKMLKLVNGLGFFYMNGEGNLALTRPHGTNGNVMFEVPVSRLHLPHCVSCKNMDFQLG